MKTKALCSALIAALIAVMFGIVQLGHSQASPFSNNVFAPQIFTASGQTGTVIQLNGLTSSSTVGSSYTAGTITLTGTSLTTATFAVLGSSDNGATFYALPIYTVQSPSTSPATSITATANGLYQVNLAGLTHIEFATSGTFTATNVTLTLTATPNGTVVASASGSAPGNMIWPGLNGIPCYSNSSWCASYSASNLIPASYLPAATANAAGVVQLAAGVTGNTLSKVASSNSYSDLSGLPTFATVAMSGKASDLIGLATAVSGMNAATANALAAAGTPCGNGLAAGGVDVHGNAVNCITPAGGSPGGNQYDVQTNAGSGALGGNGGYFYYDPTQYGPAGAGAGLFKLNQTVGANMPGFNLGGSFGSSNYHLFTSDFPTKYSAGIYDLWRFNGWQCFADGDCNGPEIYASFANETNDANGESNTIWRSYPTIAPAAYVATISSTTNNNTQVQTSTNGVNYGNGRIAILDESAQSITITNASGVNFGNNGYVLLTVSGNPYTVSVSGLLNNNINITPTSSNPTVSETLNLSSVTGAGCATNDLLTFVPAGTPFQIETDRITNAGALSSGNQTVTVNMRYSQASGSMIYCHSEQGWYTDNPSIDVNGVKLLAQVLGATATNQIAVARQGGGAFDFVGVATSGTATLYSGARLIDSTNASTGKEDGYGFTMLSDNNAFTPSTTGDHIEVTDGNNSLLTIYKEEIPVDNNPLAPVVLATHTCPVGSIAACGNLASGVNMSRGNDWDNANPSTLYNCPGCGGTYTPMPLNYINGVWGQLGYYYTGPYMPVLEFQQPGAFTLFSIDNVPGTNYMYFNGQTNGTDGWIFQTHRYSMPGLSTTPTSGSCAHAILEDSAGQWYRGGCSSGSSVSVNGTTVSSPNFLNGSPAPGTVQWALSGTGSNNIAGTVPEVDAKFVPAAVCNGASAFPAGLGFYDNNAPATVCFNSSQSTDGALQFSMTPTANQYAEGNAVLPAYWTGTNLTLYYSATVNSGNFTWDVETACPAASGATPGNPTWSSPVTATVTAPATVGQQASVTISGIAVNGANGCPATGATSPSQLKYRVFLVAGSATGNANLIGVTTLTARSQ